MDFQEIKKLIKKVGGIEKVMDFPVPKNFPEFKKIYSEGGNFDEESIILHFTESDIYIKVSGFYSSFSGQHWRENFYQVTPQQKTITIYI